MSIHFNKFPHLPLVSNSQQYSFSNLSILSPNFISNCQTHPFLQLQKQHDSEPQPPHRQPSNASPPNPYSSSP